LYFPAGASAAILPDVKFVINGHNAASRALHPDTDFRDRQIRFEEQRLNSLDFIT
jgi:hypothetical protein